MNLNKQELATVLAALRHFQRSFDHTSDMKTAYPEHFETVSPLQPSEIDVLCVQLQEPEPAAVFEVENDTEVHYHTAKDGDAYLYLKGKHDEDHEPAQSDLFLPISNNKDWPTIYIDATPVDDPKIPLFVDWVCRQLNGTQLLHDVAPGHGEPCVLLRGNVSDGFSAVGPFPDFDTAASYDSGDGWVMTMTPPAGQTDWRSWTVGMDPAEPGGDHSEIEKVLVLSTRHITEQDAKLLTKAVIRHKTLPPVVYDKTGLGWWIYAGRAADTDGAVAVKQELSKQGYSPSLLELIDRAWRLGCAWIMLDCDGPVDASLPEHEW